MPNAPKTPLRSFRIPDDEYKRAQERAAEEGTNLTAVVRAKLREYASPEDEERSTG